MSERMEPGNPREFGEEEGCREPEYRSGKLETGVEERDREHGELERLGEEETDDSDYPLPRERSFSPS